MKIDTVLCPIDFSQLAAAELDLAVQLCGAFGARLVLHHNIPAISPAFSKAWEWDQAHQHDGPSTDEAQRRVNALLGQLPAGIRGEGVISHGPVAAAVLALAHGLPADLVVLGSHGWSTEDHASVTERIIEQARCPVLTIRDASALRQFRLKSEPNAEMPRLVVPTDFSEPANKALTYAIELARELSLGLDLLHVSQSPSSGDAAMESLDKLVPPDLRARTACHARVGSVEEAIEAFVRQTEPALVVMGTHARQFWRRHFTRNVARQFLHGATCPVWFVPPTMAC